MSARVLVVDDIAANRALLEAKLSAEYFEVLSAGSGGEALALMETILPDIVLLDIMMPGMDGFEACRRLKAEPRTAHIPVVLVTALDDSANRVRGLEAGADDFLTKPVNDLTLFARVRSLVRLKTMMDEWHLRLGTCERFGMELGAPNEKAVDGEAGAVMLALPPGPTSERVAELLRLGGHSVTAVEAGADALAVGKGHDFDLVLIGSALGGEDGLRLCSQFRSQEQTRHVPILIIVDDFDFARVAKALDIGATDYLMKPIDRNELIARVRTQVRRRRYHRLLRESFGNSLNMALTDGLTGLYNRRYLARHMDGLLARAAETGKQVSVALFDIDHFKSVNDSHGHGVGDAVLKSVAARTAGNLRDFDSVARYGGEEFCVVMPDTPEAFAVLVAERLRALIAGAPVPAAGAVPEIAVTLSFGVAGSAAGDTTDTLLQRADRALYAAKAAGRNRVVAAGAVPAERVASG